MLKIQLIIYLLLGVKKTVKFSELLSGKNRILSVKSRGILVLTEVGHPAFSEWLGVQESKRKIKI